MSSEEINAEIQGIIDAFREVVREKILATLKEHQSMSEIYKAACTFHDIALDVVMKDDVRRIEYIRNQVETPEEKELFLSIVSQAMRQLGLTDDVQVEFLSPRDALLHGCKGLYTHESKILGEEKPATIFLPMTDYSTGELLSLEEIFETLAHEAAHHQLSKLFAEDIIYLHSQGRSHNQIFNAFVRRNLQILNALSLVIIKEKGAQRAAFIDTEGKPNALILQEEGQEVFRLDNARRTRPPRNKLKDWFRRVVSR